MMKHDLAKNNLHHKLLLALTILLWPNIIHGQQEVSVDKFTGTAQVSIPLYTLQAGRIAIPVFLSHTASGVKVDETGGTVGVNWSLNAEPSISREVRGLPDDININTGTKKRYGWLVPGVSDKLSSITPVALNSSSCSPEESSAFTSISSLETTVNGIHTMYDSEPDIYSYSIPGYSGKFLLSGQGQVHLIPFAPLNIICNKTPNSAQSEQIIHSFTIRTSSGIAYELDVRDIRTTKSTVVTSAVKYYSAQYRAYTVPISYATAWRASHVDAPNDQRVDFVYRSMVDDDVEISPEIVSKKWQIGGSSSVSPIEEYSLSNTTINKQIVEIRSSTVKVSFDLAFGNWSNNSYYLSGIRVFSTIKLPQEVVKSYSFVYNQARSAYSNTRIWKDEYGVQITDSDILSNQRRFLVAITEPKNCAVTTMYKFSYAGVESGSTTLPPVGCVEQDYWGYYNGNRASTLIPKLYLEPELNPQIVPNAPYRLFPLNTSTSMVLDGADRRPAQGQNNAGFSQFTIAGTLNSITYPTGGQTLLDYEAHQALDPVTNTTQYAGGVRVKSIILRDNINQVQQRKEYTYTQDGSSLTSGRFLTLPSFAFLNSLANSATTSAQQMYSASVRSGQDLSPNPYEPRVIGYAQVVERTAGKGRAVHTFTIAATAAEVAHTSGWTRSLVGIARNTSNGQCPPTNQYRSGRDVYPFPQSPDISFRQGNIESTRLDVETSNGGYAPVLLNTFTYNHQVIAASPIAKAVAYESLVTGNDQAYAYAVYSPPASVLSTVATESQITYDQQRPTQGITNATRYKYNTLGLLASVVPTADNGKTYRTRYKYATDFASTAGSSTNELAALQKRATIEGIWDEPVETITEVVDAAGNRRVTGLSLVTFSTNAAGKTIPYQIKSWNPAVPVPPVAKASGGFDSTAIRYNTQLGKQELAHDSRLRVVSTILLTDNKLTPITSRLLTGNTLQAAHLGYQGTIPVLQISQAAADQVVFSDFETRTDYQFTSSLDAYASSAARTGRYGYNLDANTALTAPVPTSGPAAYHLTYWVRTSSATAPITVALKQGNTIVWQASPTGAVANKWVMIDQPIDLSILGANRAGYQLAVSGNAAIDDITLAPVYSSTSSSTYDLTLGRTSETNPRGITTYYEYGLDGEVRYVRDQNKSIVKQFSQYLPGRQVVEGQSIIDAIGDMLDGRRVDFSASTACVAQAQYTWNFGDPTSGAANTATGISPSHVFNTGDTQKTYTVELTTTTPDGRSVKTTKLITIERAIGDISIDICARGLLSADYCVPNSNDVFQYGNSCDNSGTNSQDRITWYSAIAVAGSCPNNTTFNYEWQMASNNQATWTTMQNSSSPTYQVNYQWGRGTYRVRCIVTAIGCNRRRESEPFIFNHNGNFGCQ